jgi:hypothetical protein
VLFLIAGLVLLVAMLAMAFGPSGAAFGVIACAAAITLMVKRYRFGLRTFLVAVTLVSVWLGIKVRRDMRLDGALASIRSSGGNLTIVDRQPDFPWGLWENRYRLDYYGLNDELSEADFRHLGILGPSSVQSLDLSNTGVTDECLNLIRKYAALEILSVANDTYASGAVIQSKPLNQISDNGLSKLADLRDLKGIDLRGTQISDKGLATLASMKQLMWIQLDGTTVTGSGLSSLQSLPRLWTLELNGCELDKGVFEILSQFKALSCLGLRNTLTSDADLKLLQGNSQLSILRLGDTPVSDAALEEFQASHPNCKIER